jgi:hypothetical protein
MDHLALLSCDGNCQGLKGRMQDAERQLHAIWQKFSAGKAFAKRQTMWDALFMSMCQMSRGRDESWVELDLKVLMQVLLNFSMGLIMALVVFIIGSWLWCNRTSCPLSLRCYSLWRLLWPRVLLSLLTLWLCTVRLLAVCMTF